MDFPVCARLQHIATFLFIGALEAYLLTYLLTYNNDTVMPIADHTAWQINRLKKQQGLRSRP